MSPPQKRPKSPHLFEGFCQHSRSAVALHPFSQPAGAAVGTEAAVEVDAAAAAAGVGDLHFVEVDGYGLKACVTTKPVELVQGGLLCWHVPSRDGPVHPPRRLQAGGLAEGCLVESLGGGLPLLTQSAQRKELAGTQLPPSTWLWQSWGLPILAFHGASPIASQAQCGWRPHLLGGEVTSAASARSVPQGGDLQHPCCRRSSPCAPWLWAQASPVEC